VAEAHGGGQAPPRDIEPMEEEEDICTFGWNISSPASGNSWF